MKNKLSYIAMSLVFFNLLFIFYYYFKIVNFLYIDLFKYSAIFDAIFVNLFVIGIDIVFIFLYRVFNLQKLSYFIVVLLGIIVGILLSIVLLGINKYEFKDYLALVSYFVINIVFITYSLNFEKEKNRVFS